MDYEVSLLESIDRGGGCRSFRFERPEGYGFKAGQFFVIRLDDKLAKHFSFSNSPTEEGYVEFTTKMSESDYKKRLATLIPGYLVKISQPMGKFTYLGQKKLVFIAGGIGITPFRSIAKYLTDVKADCDVVLLWGVNTFEDAVFKGDFDVMRTQNRRLTTIYVLAKPPAEWVGPKGYITKETIQGEISDYLERTFYVCGPPKMVEAMAGLIGEVGVGGESVVVEQFSGY